MPSPSMHPQSRPCDVATIAALRFRVADLEQAFRDHASHSETCDQAIYGEEACNCGYQEVLLSLNQQVHD